MTSNNKNDVELDGAEIFADWSQLMGSAEPEKKESEALDFSLDNLEFEGGDAHWLKAFQEANLPDMDLVALQLVRAYEHDFKAEMAQLKEKSKFFLVHLAETHVNELRVAGMSEEQIALISKAILPINWTVHLKYPLAYGGAIKPEYFSLVPQYPFHEAIHHFINQQMITDAGVMTPAILYMPVPKSAVYVPFGAGEKADHVVRLDKGVLP